MGPDIKMPNPNDEQTDRLTSLPMLPQGKIIFKLSRRFTGKEMTRPIVIENTLPTSNKEPRAAKQEKSDTERKPNSRSRTRSLLSRAALTEYVPAKLHSKSNETEKTKIDSVWSRFKRKTSMARRHGYLKHLVEKR